MYTDSRGRKRPVTPRVSRVIIPIPGHDAERHEKEWETDGHWEMKNGERIWIPKHVDHEHLKRYHVKTHDLKRLVTKYRGGFKELVKKIAQDYTKKGVPKEQAEEWAKDTAADTYRSKLAKDYTYRKLPRQVAFTDKSTTDRPVYDYDATPLNKAAVESEITRER